MIVYNRGTEDKTTVFRMQCTYSFLTEIKVLHALQTNTATMGAQCGLHYTNSSSQPPSHKPFIIKIRLTDNFTESKN